MNKEETMVELEGLSAGYKQQKKEVQALTGISFKVPKGSTCALIGPSGCGKSTLLYVLSGLLTPSGGSIKVNGERVTAPRRSTALILQDYGLLPWKRVSENVGLGLEIRGIRGKQRQDRVKKVLGEVGLWEMRDRFPSQLSGGQRQRVGIARSLALDPDLLLMDEPFSSLDALNREALQDQLLNIWKSKRITMIMVTHSIEEAIYLGQKIIVLTGSPGKILDIVDSPGVGNAGYRNTQDFQSLAARLRGELMH